MTTTEDALALARKLASANIAALQKGNATRLMKYHGNKNPSFFAWPQDNKENAATNSNNTAIQKSEASEGEAAAEPRFSEYKECFKAWPKAEVSRKVAQPQMWSPIGMYNEDIDSSKWKSEQQSSFAVQEANADAENVAPCAGHANKVAIKSPPFFAWTLVKKPASEVAPKNDAPTSTSTSAEAPADVDDVVIAEEPAVPEVSSSEPAPVSQPEIAPQSASPKSVVVSVNPMGLYEDAMNASNWTSEYDAAFVPSSPSTKKTTTADATAATTNDSSAQNAPAAAAATTEEPKPAAGIATHSSTEVPHNFVWEAPEVMPTVTEYSASFVGKAVTEKVKPVKPAAKELPNPMPFFSEADCKTWLSEYSAAFVPRPYTAPPSPHVPSKTTALAQPAVADAGTDAPAAVPQEAVATQTEEQSSEEFVAPPSNASVLVEDDFVLVNKNEVEDSLPTPPPPPAVNNIFPPAASETTFPPSSSSSSTSSSSKIRKAKYTTEYADKFAWPVAHPPVPTLGDKKKNVAAAAATLPPTKAASSGSSMTTETRSQFSWPAVNVSLVRAASTGRRQAADSLQRNSGFLYHHDDNNKTDTVFSTDSLTPVDSASCTTSNAVVMAPPSHPPLASFLDNTSVGPSASSSVTTATMQPSAAAAPPSRSLTLQDSAAALRIAKETGLRLDTSSSYHQRPRSAPLPRGRGRGNVAGRIYNTAKATSGMMRDSFNPILSHKRFPESSDKQIGRWVTETRSTYTWKKNKSATH